MIGIYKIENILNGMIYIGQSVRIERRFQEHIMQSHNSQQIDKAINELGVENFIFNIIEQCSIEQLDERENYWISFYQCLYPNGYNIVENNSSIHTVYNIPKQTVLNIIQDLKKSELSLIEIAKKYNTSNSTISRINNGKIYVFENIIYPIRDTQPKKKNYCRDCGKEISYYAIRCKSCNGKYQQHEVPITREELKKLIRTTPFTKIGKQYDVSDNTIRKWCDKYHLPRKSSEIKKYNETEWENI